MASARSAHLWAAGTEPGPTLKAAHGGERRPTLDGDNPWPPVDAEQASLSSRTLRTDSVNQRDRGISSVAPSMHHAERLSARCRLYQETLARVTGRGETRRKWPSLSKILRIRTCAGVLQGRDLKSRVRARFTLNTEKQPPLYRSVGQPYG